MPKKLTMVGVLMALVFGALAVFHGSANAAPGPVQTFTPGGVAGINAGTCWDDGTGTGKHPVKSAGLVVCGANTSEFHVTGTGAAVRSFTYIQLPAGSRLTLPVTYTPSGPGQFSTDPTKAVCGAPAPGTCDAVWNPSSPAGSATGTWTNNGSSTTGQLTSETDLLCNGTPYDVVAVSKTGAPGTWPDTFETGDVNGWVGYDFVRTADAGAGTGIPGGVNTYINQIKPFPASFPFVSLDTSWIIRLFLAAGGTGFKIPDTPLQLYTASSAYVPTLNLSVAILGGDPSNPPKNDYLCLDSPQNSETNTEYVAPPTGNGLIPRWVAFTSAADFVGGQVDRIIDLQCVGYGTVTAVAGAADGDTDDDCLTVAGGDTNDGNPDQDGDGLPDGIEAFAGSSMTVADVDLDGANDYDEMFTFTNPSVADTDGDGSLDKADNGSDEVVGSLIVDDTVADDNCPAIANADQLNTDSAQSYHGGNSFWNEKNAGTSAGPNPPPTLITSYGPIVSLIVTAGVAEVTTTGTHNLIANQAVEILGVTGMGSPGANDNAFRQGTNGVRSVLAAGLTATKFRFTVPTLAPAAPAGTATGTVHVRPATGDVTNPDQDTAGDACDTDDDNDYIGDVAEPAVTYNASWSGPGGTSCVGAGGSPGLITLDTLSGDSDRDMVLDGAECRQGSRPDIASATLIAPFNATCVALSAGCAQPKAAATGEDPDADGLYYSGSVLNETTEVFYHVGGGTHGIQQAGPAILDTDGDGVQGSCPSSPCPAGTGDKDADADWNVAGQSGSPVTVCSLVPSSLCAGVGLQDGVEVRFYATEPANGDTDTDGCDDGREVADINGDRTVNPGDQAIIANRLTVIAGLDNGKAGDPVAADGEVNPYGINFDLNKDKAINPGDQALDAFYVGKGGGCQTTRQGGKTVTPHTALPF